MSLFVTLVIGAIVGWLASILMGVAGRVGLVASIAIGIVGSYAGQALVRAAGVSVDGLLAYWVVAVGGATMLIAVMRYFGIFGRLATANRWGGAR